MVEELVRPPCLNSQAPQEVRKVLERDLKSSCCPKKGIPRSFIVADEVLDLSSHAAPKSLLSLSASLYSS